MRQRIQKILSARGIASRRKAEEMLAAGQVRVNGATAALGDSADPELDEILVQGEPIPPAAKHVYIILYKPRGYVTTLSDEKGRKNVSELVKDCAARVYPVGRLDIRLYQRKRDGTEIPDRAGRLPDRSAAGVSFTCRGKESKAADYNS